MVARRQRLKSTESRKTGHDAAGGLRPKAVYPEQSTTSALPSPALCRGTMGGCGEMRGWIFGTGPRMTNCHHGTELLCVLFYIASASSIAAALRREDKLFDQPHRRTCYSSRPAFRNPSSRCAKSCVDTFHFCISSIGDNPLFRVAMRASEAAASLRPSCPSAAAFRMCVQ